MKLPRLLAAAAALLLAPMAAFAAEPTPPSPVGTWEINLTGADQGISYVTFEEDHDFNAYGISAKSRGLFMISGTWSVDEKGKLSASYWEWIDGQDVTGSITGKVTAKSISGKISATNGSFSFKGAKEKDTQNLAGTWNGLVRLGKTRLNEVYQLEADAEYPHVFTVCGSGLTSEGGEFPIQGIAIAGSKGKVRIFTESDYPWTETPGITHLFGTVTAAKGKGALKGIEGGQVLKVALKR